MDGGPSNEAWVDRIREVRREAREEVEQLRSELLNVINQQGAKITAQRDKIAMLERELEQTRELLKRERGLQIKRQDTYWALDEFVKAAREVLALPGAEEMGLETEEDG